MRNEYLVGDCEKILKKVADNSVDLVVTSPPYADSRKKTYGEFQIKILYIRRSQDMSRTGSSIACIEDCTQSRRRARSTRFF